MFQFLYDGSYHTKTTKTYLRSLGMDEETVESIQAQRDFELEREKEKVRDYRDNLLSSVLRRVERYELQLKTPNIVLEDSEELYFELLAYAQELRDVPQQAGFPYNVNWPKLK